MSSQPKEKTPALRTRLIPVSKWNKFHPWPPIGGLRYLVFHAKSNGFSHCLRRVGRTVLIDERRFFEWVEMMNERQRQNSGRWKQTDFLK